MSLSPSHIVKDTRAAVCLHCGLPLPTQDEFVADGQAPERFCCAGCRVAHTALRASGLDDTYYRLRGLSEASTGRPVDAGTSPLTLQFFDAPDFVEAHTAPNEDGTRTATFHVSGLHCAACAWLVEQVGLQEPGITGVDVDLPRTSLSLQFDPATTVISRLARKLQSFGYGVHPVDGALGAPSAHAAAANRSLLIRVGVSWALAGNVMLLAFALYSGLDGAGGSGLRGGARYLSLLLTLASLTVGGSVFFRKAIASLAMAWRSRSLARLHMDVPISLGIVTGFIASLFATVQGTGEIWFDSIAILIAALLTARWLQARGQQRALEASDRLFALMPRVARRVSGDGSEEIVPVDDLDRGDLVRIESGESCPADGTIVSGRTHFNRAALTGESRPAAAGPGDAASAGTINLDATVVLRVVEPGERSQVGQMVRWLENNRLRKAEIVLAADRVAGWFVLAVIVIAALTAIVGSGFRMFPDDTVARVVALLVIACPCALGMATPLAMVTARGRAARRGCLIKDDAALEALSRIECVVLDKTGTVTTGDLVITAVAGDEAVVAPLAAVESASRHPIARALSTRLPGSSHVVATDVIEHWGLGIEGRVGGVHIAGGSPDYISGRFGNDEFLASSANAMAARGETPVAVAVDGQWRSVLAFGDPLRADAGTTVRALEDLGKEVVLLSGDHRNVARSVGDQLGLRPNQVCGGAAPHDKERYIIELRRERRVVMVGDGVNDATALRAADVGIALGSGNAPAVVAADVLVNGGGLGAVEALVDLSVNARRVIRANLTFSVLYNAVGAAAAVAGFVTPLVAAVAMPLSSLVVVGSSLMLNYSRRLR